MTDVLTLDCLETIETRTTINCLSFRMKFLNETGAWARERPKARTVAGQRAIPWLDRPNTPVGSLGWFWIQNMEERRNQLYGHISEPDRSECEDVTVCSMLKNGQKWGSALAPLPPGHLQEKPEGRLCQCASHSGGLLG